MIRVYHMVKAGALHMHKFSTMISFLTVQLEPACDTLVAMDQTFKLQAATRLSLEGFSDDADRLEFVNLHREAMGRQPFASLASCELDEQIDLIERHAPFGNDPWSER